MAGRCASSRCSRYGAHGAAGHHARAASSGALKGFSSNTSGGFLELNGREYLIRHLGRTSPWKTCRTWPGRPNGQSVLLRQVAEVSLPRPSSAAMPASRAAGGDPGHPKAAHGRHHRLTQGASSRPGRAGGPRPPAWTPRVTFRQASFIEASVTTLQGKLIGASVFVAVILFVFLGTLRPTVIALTAISGVHLSDGAGVPAFGLSINTMTLGGLAIAIGGLVDDAVVDVEKRAAPPEDGPAKQAARACTCWRSSSCFDGGALGILYATAIIVLVFLPLFALPGIEGRLFVPLGVAFIVSTLASLLVSVTVTPVLAFYLLPRMKNLDHGDTRLLAWLKARYRGTCSACWNIRARPVAAGGVRWWLAAPPCRFSRPPSCRRSTRARCWSACA